MNTMYWFAASGVVALIAAIILRFKTGNPFRPR